MKRLLFALSIGALALPATALGKGPSEAAIDIPGGPAIRFTGYGESSGTSLGDLTQQAGFFEAAFGQAPDPMLPSRPKGDLGPRYTITYTVPTGTRVSDRIRQELYPYAATGPVTYMQPGQRLFGEETPGGWFQADRRLKDLLVFAGLPAAAPAARSHGRSFPIELAVLAALALGLSLATALVIRRRSAARIAGSPS
jgi:hypothetical protein